MKTMSIFTNDRLAWSVGSSPPVDPPSAYVEIRTSLILIVRNSNCSLPAFTQVSVASLMCSPVAHLVWRACDALLVAMVKWKSCIWTLPAPPPLPVPAVPAFDPPQLKDEISISFSCPFCWLDPSIPSIFRNASKAMAHLHSRERQMELGRSVPAQLPRKLACEIAPRGARVLPGAAEDDEVAVRAPDRRAETVDHPVR